METFDELLRDLASRPASDFIPQEDVGFCCVETATNISPVGGNEVEPFGLTQIPRTEEPPADEFREAIAERRRLAYSHWLPQNDDERRLALQLEALRAQGQEREEETDSADLPPSDAPMNRPCLSVTLFGRRRHILMDVT